MATWSRQRMGLLVSVLMLLWVVAPLATPASAQDEGPPADAPVEVAEPTAPAPESPAPEPPGPAAPEAPAAPEEPIVTEEPAPAPAEESPPEPAPAPVEQPAEPEAPTAEPAVGPTTEIATEAPTGEPPAATTTPEPAETSALAVESSLSVTVSDAGTAAPIAGASVTIYDTRWNQVSSGATDASGVAAIGSIAEGEYHLAVSAAGYHDGSLSYQWVSGPTTLAIALQALPSAGGLTVSVIDQQTGAPIAGAMVVVRGYWTGEEVASGATAADGSFATTELAGGEYGIAVTAAQHLDGFFYAQVNGPTEVTAPLQLAPLPGALTIRVVDQETSAPIAGASVVVRNTATWETVATGATDASGAFVTGDLAAGWHVIEVNADAYLGKSDYVMIDGAMERAFALQLAPLPGTLTIHVVDQVTGAPVSGATVSLWANEFISGTTDATGTFTTDELPGGTYFMQVSAEGYFGQTANPSVNGPTEVTISIEPILPGALTVTVVDAVSGAPVAGASVTVAWPTNITGVTNADGIFITPELASGNHRVEASAAGYHSTFAYAWLNGPAELTLQLTPMQSGAITVRVIDGMTGSPIAAAAVVVRDGSSQAEVAGGTTDSDGVFISGELPGGEYDIELTADHYLPNGGSARVDGPTNVLLWMQSSVAGTLTVSVVDTVAWRPIPGASVTVLDSDSGAQVFAGSTNDAGAIVADALEVGPVDVIVTASGFDPVQVATHLGNLGNQVHISLQPQEGTLTARVTDQVTGSPVIGAVVSIVGPGPEGWTVVASGVTDGSGTFVSPALPGGIYSFEASADGYYGAAAHMYLAGDTLGTLSLEPRIAGALTVLVTDSDTGEPIHKAAVTVDSMSTSDVITGTTNNNGAFVTDTLPGAEYLVEARAEGYADGATYTRISGPSEVTVALEPKMPGKVSVTVLDQFTGEPVAGAAVAVRDYDTWLVIERGETKKSGVFTSKELPGGLYAIDVRANGYYQGWDIPWVNGDTAVTIWMHPSLPGALTVTTTDTATGAPIAGAEVVVTNPLDGSEVTGVTGADGVFVSGTLAAGEYAVDVTADGYLPSMNLYMVINGGADLDVPLPPAEPGALTVSVMDETRWQPIPGSTVTIRDYWSGEAVASGVTDAFGSLVLPDVPGGDYVVEAAADGYVLPWFAWVRISGPASVTLWMTPGEPGALTVTVVDERTGAPIAGASVVVRDGSGAEVATGATDGDGAFTTVELAAGGYRFDVTADQYRLSTDQYAVVNGQRSAWVGLTLRTNATLTLSEDVATPGMKVAVVGSGFQPGEVVTVAWQDLDGIVLTTTKAKSDGTIATTVTIPDAFTSWSRVVAIGQDSDSFGAANLTVIVPETP